MVHSSEAKLYILLISIHGLIRGKDLELGRDADTGGQTLYVVDLARALGERPEVERVDLVTRRIDDPNISDDYAQRTEQIADKVRIVRIDAGPDEYIAKEQLWSHLDSFSDNLVTWVKAQPRLPDIIHSHYADAGYVGVRLANLAGVPLVHTGHSLGRDKRKRLLAKGLSAEEIENTYNMSRRIHAEEELLANARLVITSTRNEIESQYGLYNYYDPDCMAVIPPGTDLNMFHPPGNNETFDYQDRLRCFLTRPDKPMVLAISRPDERKNISVLLDAFGQSEALREAANLLIIAGNRNDIRDLEDGARAVLTELLLLIDSYDLYGRVAIPKAHGPGEISMVYRAVSAAGGVFVNPALTEPFGLTLLEAAASGLPLVATENGGPVDIISNCNNGMLVDPLDADAIGKALLHFLQSKEAWTEASQNGLEGVNRNYTWKAHSRMYIEKIMQLPGLPAKRPPEWSKLKVAGYRDRAIFSDLDHTLMHRSDALQAFIETIKANKKKVSFGIATGRRIDSALAVIKKYGIPSPDVLISSLGTRIHYGSDLTEDSYWANHVDHDWNRDRVRRLLDELPGLERQSRAEQSKFKISYFYDPAKAPPLEDIIQLLHQHELTANVLISFGQYLDAIPSRASLGQALRYTALRLGMPLEHILVAGGSGNDEDMIRGNTLGVVTANRKDEELSGLVDLDRIYFSKQPHAAGLLEAIEHYDFFNSCQVNDT